VVVYFRTNIPALNPLSFLWLNDIINIRLGLPDWLVAVVRDGAK
jgi:hypothetical protein